MDAVLCLREATHFQSMELERPEALCGLESGTRSRLWSTRGDCVCRQEVASFGLRLAGTEIACLKQLSSVFSWLQICRHRGDHESNVCVVLTAEFQPCPRQYSKRRRRLRHKIRSPSIRKCREANSNRRTLKKDVSRSTRLRQWFRFHDICFPNAIRQADKARSSGETQPPRQRDAC
jgi:hypothetical protein